MLKELSEPAGAIIYTSKFKVRFYQNIWIFILISKCFISVTYIFCPDAQRGDPTLSVLELWGAEYQESNALLLRSSDRSFLESVCQREKCPVDFVGKITGDGKVSHTVCAFL